MKQREKRKTMCKIKIMGTRMANWEGGEGRGVQREDDVRRSEEEGKEE